MSKHWFPYQIPGKHLPRSFDTVIGRRLVLRVFTTRSPELRINGTRFVLEDDHRHAYALLSTLR